MSETSSNSPQKNSSKYSSHRISIPRYSSATSSPQKIETDANDPLEALSSNQNGSPGKRKNVAPPSINGNGAEDLENRARNFSPAQNEDTLGSESPRIIQNPWSFFNRGMPDRAESRYRSDSEEEEDRSSFIPPEQQQQPSSESTDEQQDASQQPTLFTSIPLSSFMPNRFTNNAGDDKGQRKMKFPFFRKKTKDRKQGTTVGWEEEEADDAEAATGDRANRLIGSLSMACPSINLLASCLCEDEYGIARAPLLLSLLGFKVTDISPSPLSKNRKLRIDLEYGVGPQRMTWVVEKTARDLLYLHSRFKFDSLKTDFTKSEALPRYPLPPLRVKEAKLGRRHRRSSRVAEHELEEGNLSPDETDVRSVTSGGTLGAHFANLRSHMTRLSSISSEQSPEQIRNRIIKNKEYVNEVTNYLENLIKLVALKPQSNKLFLFFEISPISALLSYESGFKGKQGVIHVAGTAKSQGWRVGHFKANDLKEMIDRRSGKWFLVRNSYVMYVADINSTLPLEVFLVDSKFKIIVKGDTSDSTSGSDSDSDYEPESLVQKGLIVDENPVSNVLRKVFKHLRITLENSERKLVLVPKSEKEKKLWLKSLTDMKNATVWSTPNRFESFAPVRQNCFAQWFVDARDYFWAVSSALELAKDVIFIHDWWLSPELYLRRPANGNQQWRIDRILQRKAQQGVKIFVIVYRNVGTTVSTDSLYTKHSILSLDEENIHVIRSPNQLLQNTYFWAHHEKLCVVDHTIAFLGGIDLCYGRFDTPDHVLVDDSKVNFNSLDPESLSKEEFIKFQTFPGKDYSNPRVRDFFELDKPYESMYDRDAVPRMPWHDVHMVTSGKVARDLARHFVQRWNYLLRQKRPSRLTPILTPPPDLTDEEVKRMGLGGNCEVQLLRSSGNWSLGLKEHEQSIQNAYLKLIETSEHFVYIENQFFVTSCFIDGNEIHNRIGDALVDRIIKAHNEGKPWRAVIVIPLMPGFESQVDEPDGSSVRVIMQCQYMSISRGATSIFAKLQKYGIDPDDYIQFFSLRKWGIIGPDRHLVTEQLYIHAKTMIVDDRAAIIGSANINERSMRGFRDSEVAAVVRDTETVKTFMNGAPYLAGKFPHTLRMRLMREHLGVCVDILDVVERRFKRFEEFAATAKGIAAATGNFNKKVHTVLSAMVELASRDILEQPEGTYRWSNYQKVKESNKPAEETPLDDIDEEEKEANAPPMALPVSFNNRTGQYEANKGIRDKKKHSYDARVQHNDAHKKDVYGVGLDKYHSTLAKRARYNSNKFLKDLASKYMERNPAISFLPDIKTVQEFLEGDDLDMTDEMDEASEDLIAERNKERWQLLKKVSYLQRVASREKDQREVESKKRSAAGLPIQEFREFQSVNNSSPPSQAGTPEPNESKVVAGVSGADINGVPGNADNFDKSAERTSPDAASNENMEGDIPIVSLDEKAIRDTIHQVNAGEDHNKFIDPYLFEDPLDEEFYEDMWFDNARRNTEIFRLIFHTQPDDTVVTWKDYKKFSNLQKAFILAQAQESKTHKENNGMYHLESSDVDEPERPPTRHDRHNSQATINMKDVNNDVGLLGAAPPSERGSAESLKRKKKRSMREQTIKEENEDEFQDAPEELGDDELDDDDQEEKDDVNTNDGSSYGAWNGEAEAQPQSRKSATRRRRRGPRRRQNLGEKIFDRNSAERILTEIQGHLVMFPGDWLMRELEGGNWFYNTDRIPPIDIYD